MLITLVAQAPVARIVLGSDYVLWPKDSKTLGLRASHLWEPRVPTGMTHSGALILAGTVSHFLLLLEAKDSNSCQVLWPVVVKTLEH